MVLLGRVRTNEVMEEVDERTKVANQTCAQPDARLHFDAVVLQSVCYLRGHMRE